MSFKFLIISLLFVSVSGSICAQTDPLLQTKTIHYFDFLNRISHHNLEYAAEKYKVNIADAEVEATRIFPDPELRIGWADNGQKRMEMGYGFEAELSWDLEMGGKRKARKAVAQQNKVLAVLELQDFFHELRASSTVAFLESIQNKMLFEVQRDSYQSMKQIAQSDSIRFSLGQISRVESIQSKLEAKSMWNEALDAETQWENSLLELKKLFAVQASDSLYIPVGDFQKFDRLFQLSELIDTAKENRTDFLVAKQNQEVAQSEISLAKANRVIDLGLSLGVENNSFVRNAVAPTPGNTTVSLGLSVPLKFSNKREAELKNAFYNYQQAHLGTQHLALELEKEIRQAYRNYLNKQKQIRQFENGMLEEAKQVLEGMKYSYQRGASSLLEVLDAQRTYNETQQAYVEALFNYATALVELEKAVGMWDIEF